MGGTYPISVFSTSVRDWVDQDAMQFSFGVANGVQSGEQKYAQRGGCNRFTYPTRWLVYSFGHIQSATVCQQASFDRCVLADGFVL